VNVFPYRDWRYWPKYDPAAYADYVDKIGDLALRLLGQGHRVRFFPTHLRADVRVIRDVLERLERRLASGMRERLEVASIATVEDLAREIGRADVIVATRFHAIVIAMLLGKPVLALCNESKMSDLMVEMGQEAYSLALDALDVPTAIGRLQALQARRERVAAQLADGVEQARRTLDTQLEPVFGPRAEAREAEGAPVSSRGERVTVARLDASAGHGSW
jgi:polysaccharide pyruvyl transferase WcaK-like protein